MAQQGASAEEIDAFCGGGRDIGGVLVLIDCIWVPA